MPDIFDLKYSSSVLVVGDLILDNYWFGNVRRISPEAPVPVLAFNKNISKAGGAGNVAHNIISLGGSCTLIGCVGNDSEGELLCSSLSSEGNVKFELEKSNKFRTITKLRILDENQQIVRVDFEEEDPTIDQSSLSKRFKKNIKKHSVVILSDYGKGVLTESSISQFIKESRRNKKIILVDPKGGDLKKFAGATLMKPNLQEFEDYVGKCHNDSDLIIKGKKLRKKLSLQYLLVTLGARGMVLIDGNEHKMISSSARSVYDVSGAGDTVIATIATMLTANLSMHESVDLANQAAGIAVGKVGTATVNRREISKIIEETSEKRIYSNLDEIHKLLIQERSSGKKIVMTNGCFDILHRGHISYLEEARCSGDILVVAINSDASVKKLKGKQRPINTLKDRAKVLSSLSCVDYVISFGQETPVSLYKKILPDVLVKGGDYQAEKIAGAKEVLSAGGEVKIIEFVEGYSTTEIIKNISKLKK